MFSLPNLLTAGNLLSGILAILFALSGKIDWAPFFIFSGLIFDFLDGFAARMLKKTGELGKQLDSLADMVTFGVAPGVIMLVFMVTVSELDSGAMEWDVTKFQGWLLSSKSSFNDFIPFSALLIPFFALFRLAKFNIDERQTDSFIGLPTPANTLFFMVFPLMLFVNGASWSSTLPILYSKLVIAGCILLLGLLMISELPLFSLKFKQFGFKGNEIRYSFLLISLGLILFFKVWAFALIVFLYLILSLVENTFFKKNRNEV